MWTRSDLKAKAKIAYKKNYWKCVLVALVYTILGGGIAIFNFKYNGNNDVDYSDAFSGLNIFYILIILVAVIIGLVVGFMITAFLLNPIIVGCKSFFLKNRRSGNTDAGEVFEPFRDHYTSYVKTMFMTDLITFLWTLLLIVPGIIKSFEYRLVPYIISENPDMSWRDAMDLSRKLMNGNKWDSFVLDISFIGWALLSGLTLNILRIFMVFPYIAATEAELYIAIAHPEESSNIIPAAPESKTVEFDVTENK